MSITLAQARAILIKQFEQDPASQQLGMRFELAAIGEVRMTMTVRDDMLNGHGVCHGGLLFTLADSAFAFACNSHGVSMVSSGGTIDFLRPAHAGDRLSAHATPRYHGRRRGVYDVVVTDHEDRTIALFRGQCSAFRRRDDPRQPADL